jgi:hypothetical protein
MSSTMRILFVVALALVAFVLVMGSAYAQAGTATPTMGTATPATLPQTGGAAAVNSLTVVLLALGASAGLGGLLLRGLRQPR